MASTNTTRTKPETAELLTLDVLERRMVTPHMARVTLGGRDAARFVPRGRDQWFRLFIPVSDASLQRMPNKLSLVSYVKFLAVSKTDRPVLRNYTVRAHRPDGPRGPEIDVDLVAHGSAADGTAGPAATWATTCAPGDVVGIIDEGTMFLPPDDAEHVLVVADESALPAAAGILGSWPAGVAGTVVVEVPSDDDRQEVALPDGVEVRWVTRADLRDVPGRAALAAAVATPLPDVPTYGFVAGEQGLVTEVRRHWVRAGLPKQRITFSGYWRAGKAR